jgi:hypothetical protein
MPLLDKRGSMDPIRPKTAAGPLTESYNRLEEHPISAILSGQSGPRLSSARLGRFGPCNDGLSEEDQVPHLEEVDP